MITRFDGLHVCVYFAQYHHENGDIPKAIVIMERAFHHHLPSLHDAGIVYSPK